MNSDYNSFPWASITVMLAALAVLWKVVWDYAQMKSRTLGNIGRKEYERRMTHVDVRLAVLEQRITKIEEDI